MNKTFAGAIAFGAALALPASAQNVKVTPIGSHPGELCASDRGTIRSLDAPAKKLGTRRVCPCARSMP